MSGVPDTREAGFEFLRTELHTGLTLIQIALDTDHEEKSQRNRKNARLAYDTVQRTKDKVPLTIEHAREVAILLQQLRRKLEEAGEKFERE